MQWSRGHGKRFVVCVSDGRRRLCVCVCSFRCSKVRECVVSEKKEREGKEKMMNSR